MPTGLNSGLSAIALLSFDHIALGFREVENSSSLAGRRRGDARTTAQRKGDYDAALRCYNCKDVTSFVAGALGLRTPAYCTMIVGLIRADPTGRLPNEMRSLLRAQIGNIWPRDREVPRFKPNGAAAGVSRCWRPSVM